MHRPRLRPLLQAAAEDARGWRYALFDRTGLSGAVLSLTRRHVELLQRFDGERTVEELAAEFAGDFSADAISAVATALDKALFLDTPAFRERIAGPVRPAVCAGRSYEGDPEKLRHRLRSLFTHPSGAGLPGAPRRGGGLRAVLAPHIDYARGGLGYTFAFRELYERTDARVFVIVGTSHYSGHRFTLTRKDFQTPLGTVRSDQDYIDRIVRHYGDGLFDDEFAAHYPEHSIELEIVFLQYLYENKRDIRIVPLLVGSFHDCVQSGQRPDARRDVRRMVEALRAAEAGAGEPVCYVISGDLAHIGPDFGDPGSLPDAPLEHSRKQDGAILRAAELADPEAYFAVIADEGDQRRICGLPPTWLTLAAARPSSGRTLHYDQYVHPRRSQSVSFASMAFEH